MTKHLSSSLRAINCTDIPDEPIEGLIYIVGSGVHHFFAIIICPCGCEDMLYLTFSTKIRPNWKLIKHEDSTVSLEPSINRKVGCKSSFSLNHGRVEWIGDAPQGAITKERK